MQPPKIRPVAAPLRSHVQVGDGDSSRGTWEVSLPKKKSGSFSA